MRPIDRGTRPIAFLIGDARRDELKRIRMSHEMSCASINDNSLIFADLIYMDLRLIFQIRLWLLVIIALWIYVDSCEQVEKKWMLKRIL